MLGGRFDCISAIVVYGEIHVELNENAASDVKDGRVQIQERGGEANHNVRVLTSGMAIEDAVKLRWTKVTAPAGFCRFVGHWQ